MKSEAQGFNEFLKSMLKDSEEKKGSSNSGGGRIGADVINGLLHNLLEETLSASKALKCECLTCKCMNAIEDVIEKEFQAKGKEYQNAVKIIDGFSRGTDSNLTEVGIATGNTANTFKKVLENTMKDYIPVALSYKVVNSRGYEGI
jgi:hypothetical protein